MCTDAAVEKALLWAHQSHFLHLVTPYVCLCFSASLAHFNVSVLSHTSPEMWNTEYSSDSLQFVAIST